MADPRGLCGQVQRCCLRKVVFKMCTLFYEVSNPLGRLAELRGTVHEALRCPFREALRALSTRPCVPCPRGHACPVCEALCGPACCQTFSHGVHMQCLNWPTRLLVSRVHSVSSRYYFPCIYSVGNMEVMEPEEQTKPSLIGHYSHVHSHHFVQFFSWMIQREKPYNICHSTTPCLFYSLLCTLLVLKFNHF